MKNFKRIFVVFFVLVLLVATAACGKTDDESTKTPADNTPMPSGTITGKLANQIYNSVLYYQQGYSDSWTVVTSPDEYMIDKATGLILKAWPKEAEGKVEYRIYYKQDLLKGLLTFDVAIGYLLDENHEYFFNKYFIYEDGVARDMFECEHIRGEYPTVIYNDREFYPVNYTFTKNNGEEKENWKGIYNLNMSGNNGFVITFEAIESEYDNYMADFIEMINDWRKISWKDDSPEKSDN